MSDFDEVYKRLNDLDKQSVRVEETVKTVCEEIKRMSGKFDQHLDSQNELLHGEKGMFTRVRGIEQREKYRSFHIGSIWTAFCALVGKLIWDKLSGK